jgi:nickel/cobalt exporter
LLGNKYIIDQAEPWLWLLSGCLVVLLALRLIWSLRSHSHDHHHHHHGHDHQHHDHAHAGEVKPPRHVTTSDIVWFGFTGGLLPCPSAIAVLLVCIQIKAFALGVAMVAAFSVGLAITLVAIGIGAAWGANKATKRWPWLERMADRAPYFSGGLMLVVGLFMIVTGIGSIHAADIRK